MSAHPYKPDDEDDLRPFRVSAVCVTMDMSCSMLWCNGFLRLPVHVQGIYCLWSAAMPGAPSVVLEASGQPSCCTFSGEWCCVLMILLVHTYLTFSAPNSQPHKLSLWWEALRKELYTFGTFERTTRCMPTGECVTVICQKLLSCLSCGWLVGVFFYYLTDLTTFIILRDTIDLRIARGLRKPCYRCGNIPLLYNGCLTMTSRVFISTINTAPSAADHAAPLLQVGSYMHVV